MFGKLGLFYDALQIGEEIASPEKWKAHLITGNKLALLFTTLLGIAHAYGYKIDVDNQTILEIAGGIVALANWLITLATSKKVGLPLSTLVAAQQVAGSVQQGTPTVQTAVSQEFVQPVDSALIGEAEAALAADRGRNAEPRRDNNERGQ